MKKQHWVGLALTSLLTVLFACGDDDSAMLVVDAMADAAIDAIDATRDAVNDAADGVTADAAAQDPIAVECSRTTVISNLRDGMAVSRQEWRYAVLPLSGELEDLVVETTRPGFREGRCDVPDVECSGDVPRGSTVWRTRGGVAYDDEVWVSCGVDVIHVDSETGEETTSPITPDPISVRYWYD